MPQQMTAGRLWRPRPVVPRLTAVAVRAILSVAMLIVLLTLALAESRKDVRIACSADYQSYCSDIRPGGGRVRECMTRNFDKLSDACKKATKAESK